MQRATVRQLAGLGLVVAIAAIAATAISPSALLAHMEALLARPVLLVGIVVAVYLVRPLLAWPISTLSVLLGYLFGPVAVPFALAGAVVTSLPAYCLARYLGHDTGLFGRIGQVGENVRRTAGDLRGITAVRVAPLPTDPVSYGAGVAGVPIRPYVIGTALGETPWVIAAVLLGASMNQLVTTGLSTSPLVIATTIVLALFLLLSRPAYNRLTETSSV